MIASGISFSHFTIRVHRCCLDFLLYNEVLSCMCVFCQYIYMEGQLHKLSFGSHNQEGPLTDCLSHKDELRDTFFWNVFLHSPRPKMPHFGTQYFLCWLLPQHQIQSHSILFLESYLADGQTWHIIFTTFCWMESIRSIPNFALRMNNMNSDSNYNCLNC